MKKIFAALTSVLFVAGLLGAPSSAAPKEQKVEGSILTMAPFTDFSCYSGLHRRSNVILQENFQGVVGYHFDVEPATVGKPFKLEVTGGQNDVDLDIFFYTEFGTVEQATDTGHAPYNVSFETREPGGEKGIVPKLTKKVIVCMVNGFGATFTYTAAMGKKK